MRTVETSCHISGTCKMGPASDGMAVVDQFCWMYSVKGLRIAEESINSLRHPGQHQRYCHNDRGKTGRLDQRRITNGTRE